MALAEHSKCTGCMSCVNRCPQKCIHLEEDVLGNAYPEIEKEKCIECGLCEGSCPELHTLNFREIRKAYAVWSKDDESRKTSASGGAAAELYNTALLQDYWICGAEWTDHFHVEHTVTKDKNKIQNFKKSKYVYSEIDSAYKKIEQLLKVGEKVLVISLPCKIAGLYAFLRKEYPNLITGDIVCHGTPSNHLLQEHISGIKNAEKAGLLKFRNDNEFLFLLSDEDGKKVYQKVGRTDEYLVAFLEGMDYRQSCYQCSYARPERIADFTLCDFWGLGTEIPFNHPYTGSISAVLINTSEGQKLFEATKDRIFYEERPVEEAVKGNAQLNAPTCWHPKRSEFEEKYQTDGFDDAVRVCLGEVMTAEKKRVYKAQIRALARQIAGVFIKKYRR